jgi:hypothetical protein
VSRRENPLPLGVIYLSGVRNRWIDALSLATWENADEAKDLMPIGILVQPATARYLDDKEYGTQNIYPWVGIDNGCFSPLGRKCFTMDRYLGLIERTLELWGDHVLFATARDVPEDWKGTLKLSLPMLPILRRAGVPAAIALQDGATVNNVPWDECDAVFIGGSTAWKLGEQAKAISIEARRRRKWSHMGRVNSMQRIRIAQSFQCGSADGTFLKRAGGPKGVARVEKWAKAVWEADPGQAGIQELERARKRAYHGDPVVFAKKLIAALGKAEAEAFVLDRVASTRIAFWVEVYAFVLAA